MRNNFYIIYFFLIIFVLNIFHVSTTQLYLNKTIQGYLHPKSYAYYSLLLDRNISDAENNDSLLIEVRRNENQDLLDNIYSDPNIYISTIHSEPGPNLNEWSSNRFGDEIISINKINSYSNQVFYISIYCQFSCNYLLKANIHKNYEMKVNKIYFITMLPFEKTKLTFTSKDSFNKMKVNCISSRMKPFRIYLAKKDPSSTNTIQSSPIFLSGYYFLIQKGDNNYALNAEYNVLIENKEFKQDLAFWVSFDQDETKLDELSPVYGMAEENSESCYYFNIERHYFFKNIVISTTLFNGNGFIKIGGWEKVKDMKINFEDENIYEIVSDKWIILTEKNFKKFGNFDKDKNINLHFCFIAKEETSYLIKIYYQEHLEQAQKLNFLLPGITSDDMLPNNTLTKYNLLYLEQNKDIKINLKVKNGEAKLYTYFSYEENDYINKTNLEQMLSTRGIIISKQISYQNYEIKLDKNENLCLLEHNKNEKECSVYAIVDCFSDTDCLYEIYFDHIGGITYMKPKVLYSNVITQKEKDLYEIHITDQNIKNFAVILTQNTGITKLKLSKYFSIRGNLNFGDSQKFNKEYMPNVIEVKLKDFPAENLIGTFQFEVEGSAFSSYEIYYYTFDDTAEQLDHKTISMTLIKGKMIQDYIKLNHNIKVYSYDNSDKANDLFIYINQKMYGSHDLFIFKNLDDYYYENHNVKGYIYKSGYNNYIHMAKDDPNYIEGEIYIMVFLNRYSRYDNENDILYKEKNIETPFTLVITDENTPITLLEGVEYKHPMTSLKSKQIFYYNHFNKEKDFIMNINVPNTKIKFGLKVGQKDIIYEKIVLDSYNVRISTKDLYTYWPSEKSCIIEIKIESVNYYEQDFDVILICKSSENSVVQLSNNGLINKRKIAHQEKHYYVFDANFIENYDIKINSISSKGKINLYAKTVNSNQILDPINFPDEYHFDFSSNFSSENDISTLSIPYKSIQAKLPCKILLTVQGFLNNFYTLQGEYSISISNMLDDIFPNKNYKLMISKDEIKYYHFNIKGNKKRLSISMTNKEEDAFMYLNYGTMNNEITKFQWRSEGNYNEYIDISTDDSYFISRKIKNLDGDYYLAIRGFENTYYNLYISDLDIKLMTISEEFPGVCQCEEGDFCYFRYEIINNMDIALLMKKELVFYFEFTYGNAQIFANLYETGNNGQIIKDLPNFFNSKFYSNYGEQYLKINLSPGDEKYTFDSVIVLGTKCHTKSLFDFNVRPLWKSGDIIKNDYGMAFLNLNKDNIFYLSSLSQQPIKLIYYYDRNDPLYYEAKSIMGSAEVHAYITTETKLFGNLEENKETVEDQNKQSYKHLAKFSVDELDSLSFFDSVLPDDAFNLNLVFEVKAIKDCLFSLNLNYREEILYIPMSRQIQGKLVSGKFYAYIELLKEYEEIVISIDKMHTKSEFSIYAKINILNSSSISFTKISMPSDNNYDAKGKTNTYSASLAIKIKNVDKDIYKQNKKILALIYVEADNHNTYEDRLNILAYPNVDHYELVQPKANKYIYNSITHLKEDRTVFSLKKQNKEDNLLIIEISSCKGNFGYRLFNNLTESNIIKDKDETVNENQGKKTIVKKMGKYDLYYLSVFGLQEDEIVFEQNRNKTGIDFLMYYYTTNEEQYSKTLYDTKIDYLVYSPGYVLLTLPNLISINSKNNKNKLEDLSLTVILSENSDEFNYMGSICFLTKKYEYISKNMLYENITIEIDKDKNQIEIKKLNKNKKYYVNILITNSKTGQIFAMEPIEIIPNKFFTGNVIATLLIIAIVILALVIFYFYRKYRIANAIINFENSDIKKMGKIPKSISDLKKIQDEKNKKAKEKYNSLTEDSGDI